MNEDRVFNKGKTGKIVYASSISGRGEKLIFITNISWWVFWTLMTLYCLVNGINPLKFEGYQSTILLIGLYILLSVIFLLIMDDHSCKQMVIYEVGITPPYIQLFKKTNSIQKVIPFNSITSYKEIPFGCIVSIDSGKKVKYFQRQIGEDSLNKIIKVLKEHNIEEKN